MAARRLKLEICTASVEDCVAAEQIHADRSEILPAGGINRFTVADVVSRTGCDQVHASLGTCRKDQSVLARPQVSFGGTLKLPEDEFTVTDPDRVAGCGGYSSELGMQGFE